MNRFPRYAAGRIVVLAIVITFFQSIGAIAAPKSDLWPRWEAYDAKSAEVVDHSAWDRFLSRYVVADHPSGIHLVRYADVKSEDKKALVRYVQYLEGLQPAAYSRPEQMAFWINLYNAVTVKLVLEAYPVDSIKDVSGGFFSFGPWDDKVMVVQSEKMSLNDVEHRVLRPIWKDPRIHYAVNCASYGCPNLAAKAFTSDRLEEMLEAAARDFVNHSRGAEFKDGELVVSSIYDWYQVDFGGTEKGVVAHLLQYAAPELARRLRGYDGGLDDAYDWRLNQP